MNYICWILVIQSKILYCVCTNIESEVVFAVLSQDNAFHDTRADLFRQHLTEQSTRPDELRINVVHKKWPFTGSWSLLPLFSIITRKYGGVAWLLICDEETRIDLPRLHHLLLDFDSSQEHFLGRALYDSEPVITHHFAFADDPQSFAYPDIAAGLLLSRALITTLARRWEKHKPPVDFTIDVKHELAMFVWDEGRGSNLTALYGLCAGNDNMHCTTTYPSYFPQCGKMTPDEDIHVAVKTCEKFHHDRLVVVRHTWGQDSASIVYYSDASDASIPTVNLGILNTERGHCGKTLAILKHYLDTSHVPWLIVVDDDTIISIQRLRELLSCYDPSLPIALGERYGYSVTHGSGYDYITGGGGMVFSRVTVERLVADCECPTLDSPDDMVLGRCLLTLAIPVIHSRHFHQARPLDYSPDFLAHDRPVSFHKHWNIDPYLVYMDWFVDHRMPAIRDEL